MPPQALWLASEAPLNTVAAILAGVALVPSVRVLRRPPVWREFGANKPLAAVALTAALLAAIAGWLARAWLVAALPVIAVVLAVLVVLAWWRARDTYGAGRGWPPGSLGMGASLDAIAHQDFYAKATSRHGPVFKMAQFHRPVACITDLRLGLEVLDGQRARMRQPTLPFGRLSPGNYIEFMNDERHARYRGILRTALSGRVVAAAQPGVADVIRAQLTLGAHDASAAGMDPRPLLERVAFGSLARTMFGIPVDDPRVDEMRSLFGQLGATRTFVERRPEDHISAFRGLVALVRSLGNDLLARSARGEPIAASVLGEALRADPAHLGDDTLLGNLVLIVHVTRSNVRGLLGWVVKELLDHPDVLQELREATKAANGPARIEAIATQVVNETLRLHQSEYLYREVVEEVQVGPYRVPPGWLLRVCVRECHDDPTTFPEPGAFRPQRFAGRSYARTEYLPFSDGTHSCFGAGLALMIARTMVTALAVDWDGRIVADGPVERDGNRHWSHWRPNSRLRVSLAPRNPPRTAASAART